MDILTWQQMPGSTLQTTNNLGVIRSMNKPKKKVLGPAYSSYHGKVHIPLITTKLRVSLGQNVIMNSGCPNHVVVNVPDRVELNSAETRD